MPFLRLGFALTGMREDPVAHLVGQVEALGDPQRLLVMCETPSDAFAQHGVEGLFSRVAEGRVPGVVAEADRLDQVLVECERAGDDARDGGRLERMGHPRAVMVAGGIDEDLGLPFQAPEGLRVDDTVAVALKGCPQAALRGRNGAVRRLRRSGRPG